MNIYQVQTGNVVSFENPIVSYAGVGEMERAFRGRLLSHPQNDVKTVLECINVEASEDSICGGKAIVHQQQQHREQDGTSPLSLSPPSLVDIIPSTDSSSSLPKVEVTHGL